jgi:ubiquinone/menaquinone biosynthesis C-methylase UbiE
VRSPEGVLDFVRSHHINDERAFYNDVYQAERPNITKQSIDIARAPWHDPWSPQNQLVWESLGDIRGKRVLLIGNGHSTKEMFLLTQHPAGLVYSDLSPHAVANIRDRFDLSEYADRIAFAAIDAHELPFPDESVDIIYGYGMVHHLPDIERFFAEVMRVLAPGGRCVFMDDAYAPLWHWAKQTVLRPLMKYSHKTTGISPEDYRFSMSGGFREKKLAELIRKQGGYPWFRRTAFLQYVWYRGSEKLLHGRARRIATNATISRMLHAIDNTCAHLPVLNKNLIRLVWGFNKEDIEIATG